MNNNDILKKYNLYESDEYNNFKNEFQDKMNNNKTQSNFFSKVNPNYSSSYSQIRPQMTNAQNANNSMGIGNLQLIKTNKKDNEESNKKIHLLKIKTNKLSQEFELNANEGINQNINNIDNVNNINNVNNNKKDDENSGEYSPGEVRFDESY